MLGAINGGGAICRLSSMFDVGRSITLDLLHDLYA